MVETSETIFLYLNLLAIARVQASSQFCLRHRHRLLHSNLTYVRLNVLLLLLRSHLLLLVPSTLDHYVFGPGPHNSVLQPNCPASHLLLFIYLPFLPTTILIHLFSHYLYFTYCTHFPSPYMTCNSIYIIYSKH